MELGPADFSGFFKAIHGYEPFPWQQALVDHLANCDEWPDVLDLPTGTGKTAALDIAVFHLALRADSPQKAALRIALVVDRRLVVDDAFERAKKITNAICEALDGSADGCEQLAQVARRLRGLGGNGAPPLVAKRLRGGAPLEHDWARTPMQPTILCSTVDQVGSRLLFRGYGVSDRMKPIHAGLLGANCLILLDEAHLSEPFRQTIKAIRGIGRAQLQMALLTATPGTTAERPFELASDDKNHPELRKRIQAKKPCVLRPPLRATPKAAAKKFANEARAMASRLRNSGVSPTAVGIVVNRVALARAIHDELVDGSSQNGKFSSDHVDSILLIGRSRSVDRDKIVQKLAPFRTAAQCRNEANPLFVVATQCLEVGVDLDLDGLVTQAASLDALRQRFGRLNRAGRKIATEGVLISLAADVSKKADDPVYGDRIRLTWEALKACSDGDEVDWGVEALPASFEQADIDMRELSTALPDAPVVMPAYLDLWSQTFPRPAADPEIGLFLHGRERKATGVSIVWRSDITERDLSDESDINLTSLLSLVPPRSAEAVEIPLWTARAWLRRTGDEAVDLSAGLSDLSDVPARDGAVSGTARVSEPRRRRYAFRWAGSDDRRTGVIGPNELRVGDLVIVPSSYGGCDKFGWKPESGKQVTDVGDEVGKPYWGRRCAVRIAPDIVGSDESQWNRISVILAREDIGGLDLVESVLEVLPSVIATEETASANGEASQEPIPRNVRQTLEALRRTRGRIDVYFPYAGGREAGAVLVAGRGIENSYVNAAIPATEDDTASHTFANPVSLDDHGRRVADLAECFARTIGLNDMAGDIHLAAFLHDAGKANPRFQTMLSGGDLWNRPDGPPLAKSKRPWSSLAWKGAGLPVGWRHEALSVQMARIHPRFSEASDSELVLWLIGTHHGMGRPLYGFLDMEEEQPLSCLGVDEWRLDAGQPGPHSLAFDFNGADWPSLFERLRQRYGIWGLAHMEAILRLADHRVSEMEREL